MSGASRPPPPGPCTSARWAPPGAADAILRKLEAYGLHWDGAMLVQSQRDDAYAEALATLEELGAAYPCACTRSQLAQAPRNHEGHEIHPRTCRTGLPARAIARARRRPLAAPA